MRFSTLLRLGTQNARCICAEYLYKATGYDVTIPISISGYLTYRCNIKCLYCGNWRRDYYAPEMSVEEWKQALLSIKSLTGSFHIGFTGGEPFVKPGIMDLLAYCRDNRIYWSATTNGTTLTKKNIDMVVLNSPFYLNISIDSSNSTVNDYLKGHKGHLDKLASSLNNLRKKRDNCGLNFPIIVKATISSLNFQHLPKLVDWALSNGATTINFSPLNRENQETFRELWIKKGEVNELARIIRSLIKMKAAGYSIVNSPEELMDILHYFREQKNHTKQQQCRHVFHTFRILPNGDITSCASAPPIGNIRRQNAKEIWYSKTVRQMRNKGIYCTSQPYYTPVIMRGISQKVRIAINMMRRRSEISFG